MDEELRSLMNLAQHCEDIKKATIRWVREHGYFVAWDYKANCWRIVLEGIDRKDDEFYPTEFQNREDAYYRIFKLIAGVK